MTTPHESKKHDVQTPVVLHTEVVTVSLPSEAAAVDPFPCGALPLNMD